MKYKYFLLALLLLGALSFPQFSPAQEIQNVKVSELTDAQIKQLMSEVSKLGMSMEDAAALAKMRGATDAQIKDLMGRILTMNQAKEKDSTLTNKAQGSRLKNEDLMKKERIGKKEKKEVDSIGVERRIFGFDLFNNENLTFEPSVNIQTPKEYVIGIGDEFIINIWGGSEALYQSKVDKNGAIQIPQIGPIYVNGLSYEVAESLIRKRLASIHNGLAGLNPNTYAIVNLGGLRSIQITVVGDVMTPGTYTLPATASLFNALYQSGGPNKTGSFRDIRLIRNGKILRHIDIYNFLVNADATDNIPLRDQDVVFIPTYQKRVSADGEFLRNGLFEMKGQETLGDLIHFTGGFTNKAFQFQVAVNRRTSTEMKLQDIDPASWGSFVMENGDSVKVGNILDRYANRVKIGGAVFRPGTFELVNGMTLLDLITKAGGLKEDAYLNRGQILRLKDNGDTLSVAFDVASVSAGIETVPLFREDSVSIKTGVELREEYYVEIQGEVNNPGEKSYYDNMTVQDLVYLAGGFKESADVNVIEIARRLTHDEAAILSDSLGHVFTVSVPRDLKPGTDDSRFILRPFDLVSVRKAQGYRDQGSVAVSGEVLYAGYYSIKSRQNRISDLIKWSGGLTPDAYVDAARLYKTDSIPVGIDLKKILIDHGSRLNMILDPGDSLYIPKQPQIVNIVGQVQKPFANTFIPNKGVKYYVKNAGGWAESPAKRSIYVTYPDGSSDNTRTFIVHRYPPIKPGSTIVIPKEPVKPPKPDRTAVWLALASTMSSIALTLVTILNLTK